MRGSASDLPGGIRGALPYSYVYSRFRRRLSSTRRGTDSEVKWFFRSASKHQNVICRLSAAHLPDICQTRPSKNAPSEGLPKKKPFNINGAHLHQVQMRIRGANMFYSRVSDAGIVRGQEATRGPWRPREEKGYPQARDRSRFLEPSHILCANGAAWRGL